MFWKLIRRRLSSETSQRREAETREGGGGEVVGVFPG